MKHTVLFERLNAGFLTKPTAAEANEVLQARWLDQQKHVDWLEDREVRFERVVEMEGEIEWAAWLGMGGGGYIARAMAGYRFEDAEHAMMFKLTFGGG
jgi:hypothetical protein